MRNHNPKTFLRFFVLLLFVVGHRALAQEPLPSKAPVNVAGNWTISSKGPTGEVATKYIELNQEGSTITGHFKGPNQSGGLEGSINEQHILFRTRTREPLTFRGRVEGNTMSGTFHDRQGTGEWNAVRTN